MRADRVEVSWDSQKSAVKDEGYEANDAVITISR
jgi:hypothetical protein